MSAVSVMLPETEHKEKVLHFAPSDRGAVTPSMKIASDLASRFPVTAAEVKGPAKPVFLPGTGRETGLAFSTPVAPLIAKELPGSLLPHTPPCPEMKEILPTNLATCTLPAAVHHAPDLLGLSAPVRSLAPPLPLPLETRETQMPGLHFIFSVEHFTLPSSPF
jgi:hypothetical protein